MKACRVSFVRDLFGRGTSEAQMYDRGEYSGQAFRTFHPNAKTKEIWNTAPTILEPITRRLPSSFADQALFSRVAEFHQLQRYSTGYGYNAYDYPDDGQYPALPLDERTAWLMVLSPAALPDFDLRKFAQYLDERLMSTCQERGGTGERATCAHRLRWSRAERRLI
eukprot:11039295-Alexandrium_andersonii.AAC.1